MPFPLGTVFVYTVSLWDILYFMNRKDILNDILRFDKPYDCFELLETESGDETSFCGAERERRKEEAPQAEKLYRSLNRNKSWLKKEFHTDTNTDIILREFDIGKRSALAVFVNGMADENQISDFILRPSLQIDELNGCADILIRKVLPMQEVEATNERSKVKTAICEGRTALFVDGCADVALMDTRGFASRTIGTTQNETVVIGPNEAFTENLRTNVTQMRRIIKKPEFICKFQDAGASNHIRLALCYIEGLTNRSLLREVQRRLSNISTDVILDAGSIKQLIETHPFAPISQSMSTERPDRAAMAVMQGKVVLLLEGSPQALVMPVTLFELMASAEDAYQRQPIGSLVKLVRYFGAALSVLMPAYFLAVAMHHQGLLSSEVLNTVIASREMVFLPMPVEMVFLLIVFQLVREAGVRVPGAAGQTVGIIGGLILGQAAVAANIVSAVVLIIVALTGLGNYTIPNYELQLSVAYFRIILCILASLSGLLGFFSGILIAIALLCSMKSFGVPMLSPLSPATKRRHGLVLRRKLRQHSQPIDYSNSEGQV